MPRHDMLTWNDVLKQLQKMSAERLEDTATIHTQELDEFYGITGFGVSKDGDAADSVLDHGHLYFQVDG